MATNTLGFNGERDTLDNYMYLYCLLIFGIFASFSRLFKPPAPHDSIAVAAADQRSKVCDAATGDGHEMLARVVGVRHIAVTMDGNRRFGERKHGNKLLGHWDGAEALMRFIKGCTAHGVEMLTVYAFSTENWNRSSEEVDMLMGVITKYADEVLRGAAEQGTRVRVLSSDAARLPGDVRGALRRLETETAENSGLQLNLCISYGGRGDIVAAARALAEESVLGHIEPGSISEEALSSRLTTGGLPDPDILLRTSGEQRLSNFVLWQCAYAELHFFDKLWPEVDEEDVRILLLEHLARRRRFGK